MFLAPVWKNWCVDKETTDDIENYEPAELNTLLEQRYAKISILWEPRSMLKPVFTSRKLSQTLSVKENKPPIVNTQCVVYLFQCDLCDANYVGYTARHLHQRISEHRYSAIGKDLETQHGNNKTKTGHLFKVLRKCNSKFDCLVYEMLYIKDIKPSLNT